MAEERYSSNGEYALAHFFLFSKDKETDTQEYAVDLVASFIEASVFESLDGFMTGYVTIPDSVNLNDYLPLYGNERIELKFSTSGSDFDLEFVGRVYKISERIRISDQSMGYKISFCSDLMMRNERQYVNRAFEGLQSDCVEDIYNDYLISTIDIDKYVPKPFEAIPTVGIRQYAFGVVKPLDAILALSRDAISSSNDVGYLFYEDHEQVNYKPIQYLYQQEPVAKYTSALGGVYQNIDNRIVEQFEAIQAISYKEENSLFDRLTDGLHGSDHYYFDLTTKEFVVHHYTKDDDFNKEKSLGEVPTKKELDDGHDVSYMGYVTDDILSTEYEMRSKMKLTESRMFSANIVVFGDSRLKAGDVLEVYLPLLNVDQQESTNIYNGNVLIFAIRHTITQKQYMQEIDIIKDAYNGDIL